MKIKDLDGIAKRRVDLFFRPNIERAFSMFRFAMLKKAVGVFGGKISAFLGCHVASDVIENIACDRFELSILSNLKGIDIGDGELRLIGKHFFEVQYVPVTINRVTMKASAQMIVHSTGSHFTQGKQTYFERLFTGFAVRIAHIKSSKKIER